MTITPDSLQRIYYWLKFIGAAGAAVAVFISSFKYLKAVYKQRQDLSNTVTLLATNHLPHLQKSLDSHGELLTTLTSDVRNVGTQIEGVEKRQEDLSKGVHTLGESFIRHLEGASKETLKKKSRKS